MVPVVHGSVVVALVEQAVTVAAEDAAMGCDAVDAVDAAAVVAVAAVDVPKEDWADGDGVGVDRGNGQDVPRASWEGHRRRLRT